jgi:hypothetical protein
MEDLFIHLVQALGLGPDGAALLYTSFFIVLTIILGLGTIWLRQGQEPTWLDWRNLNRRSFVKNYEASLRTVLKEKGYDVIPLGKGVDLISKKR